MADFSAETLVELAKARFGETVLQNRIRGALGNAADADVELTRIALSVISSIAGALSASTVGWPLPGTWPEGSTDGEDTDISGDPYREVWPFALQESALDIFNRRTWAGYSDVPQIVRDLGGAAEKLLQGVSAGSVVLDLGEASDVEPPEPLAARDRDGKALIPSISNRETIMNAFEGGGWQYLR